MNALTKNSFFGLEIYFPDLNVTPVHTLTNSTATTSIGWKASKLFPASSLPEKIHAALQAVSASAYFSA